LGLKVILKPQNFGDTGWIFEKCLKTYPAFSGTAKKYPAIPAKKKKQAINLKNRGIKYIDLEFSRLSGEDVIKRSNPEKMVCGHVITVDELKWQLKARTIYFALGTGCKGKREPVPLFYFSRINQLKII